MKPKAKTTKKKKVLTKIKNDKKSLDRLTVKPKAKAKAKKKGSLKSEKTIGILVEGTAKSLEQMTKSIEIVLAAVHKQGFADVTACEALRTLQKVAEARVDIRIADNLIKM